MLTPLDAGAWTYLTFDLPQRAVPFGNPMEVTATANALTVGRRPVQALGCVCSAVANTRQAVVGVLAGSDLSHQVQLQLVYAAA